jgi:long-chain acyl-CoA synthetase
MSVEAGDTIPKLIQSNSQKWGSRTAMCMKKLGIWQSYTWHEYYEQVKYLSLGLISLGLKPGDVVCIIGDNEPEWFWGEFAVQAGGGIVTGIFVDSIPSEVKYIASHAKARFALVNDQEQADKFLEIKAELPALEKIIYWNPKGLKNYEDPLLIGFTEVISRGKELERASPTLFEQNVARWRGDDIAFIYYTAGTTGLPKGAKLSHRALINTARDFIGRYPLSEKDDLVSNFPAAWVGDSFFATIPHLLSGARLNFPEEPQTIFEDTREVGPDFVIYGPRQWEDLASSIQSRMLYASFLKRFTYKLCLPIGYQIADMKLRGEKPNLRLRSLYRAANLLLFKPLRDRLGLSKVRFAVTGGSVTSLDVFRFINGIGVELRQNYASTEAGFISSHRQGEIRLETVGRPAPAVEVRVAETGELLVRSECVFSGYLNDVQKTRQTLVGGWCHTGDAVRIDDEGQLVFIDRLDHMGELSSGAKYAPQYIEGRLRSSKYIKNALVIGDKDKAFVSAILNVDPNVVRRWAEHQGVDFATFVDLSQKKEIAELIAEDLVGVNRELPESARVKRFVLLHKEFDPDEAELTRTRKLRRRFIEQRYQDLIDAIYNGTTTVDVQAMITYRDGRKGVVTTSINIWSIPDEPDQHATT